jgi:hypothetical protein
LLNNQPSLLDSEEEALVHLRTKLAPLMLYAQEGMYQRLVQTLPLNKTSPDGHFQKLADQIMTQRNLTEIKLMTLDHQLANSVTQKIHQLDRLILALLEEMEPQDLALLKTRCRVDKVSNFITPNGDALFCLYTSNYSFTTNGNNRISRIISC